MARGLTLKLNVNIGSEDVLKLLQVLVQTSNYLNQQANNRITILFLSPRCHFLLLCFQDMHASCSLLHTSELVSIAFSLNLVEINLHIVPSL